MTEKSGWTFETLLTHLTGLALERKLRVDERFDAQEKAITKAEENAEKWRQNANEWRGAMNDREAKLMPRLEVESRINTLGDRIDEITKRFDKQSDRAEGRGAGVKDILGWIVAAGAVTGLIVEIIGRYAAK